MTRTKTNKFSGWFSVSFSLFRFIFLRFGHFQFVIESKIKLLGWRKIYAAVKVEGATPKRRRFVRGRDKPRLMGVAITIDPFQVVFVFLRFPQNSVFFFLDFNFQLQSFQCISIIFSPLFFCCRRFRWVTGTSCPTPTMRVLPCRMPINISRNVSRISTGSPHRKSSWVDEIMRCGLRRISDQFPWLGIFQKWWWFGWESQGQI